MVPFSSMSLPTSCGMRSRDAVPPVTSHQPARDAYLQHERTSDRSTRMACVRGCLQPATRRLARLCRRRTRCGASSLPRAGCSPSGRHRGVERPIQLDDGLDWRHRSASHALRAAADFARGRGDRGRGRGGVDDHRRQRSTHGHRVPLADAAGARRRGRVANRGTPRGIR